MKYLYAVWRWLTTPKQDTTAEWLKTQEGIAAKAAQAERDRKVNLATLPELPDLSDDPNTDVPAFHPGQVRHVDLTKQVKLGEQAPSRLQDVAPSEWDLLNQEEKDLFEQITPHDETKIIRLPVPAEQTTADWVTEQLSKAGYSEAAHLRFAGWRRVAVGMSMHHLDDLKRRAEKRDMSLSVHDLIALRSRGIA